MRFGDNFDMIIQTLPPLLSNVISIACLLAITVNNDKVYNKKNLKRFFDTKLTIFFYNYQIGLILSKMEKHWVYWASKPMEIEFIRENAERGRKLCIKFIGIIVVKKSVINFFKILILFIFIFFYLFSFFIFFYFLHFFFIINLFEFFQLWFF